MYFENENLRKCFIDFREDEKNYKGIIYCTTLEEAKKIKDKEIAEALDLPPIKYHCSVLAEETIQTAIKDWEEKKKNK